MNEEGVVLDYVNTLNVVFEVNCDVVRVLKTFLRDIESDYGFVKVVEVKQKALGVRERQERPADGKQDLLTLTEESSWQTLRAFSDMMGSPSIPPISMPKTEVLMTTSSSGLTCST